MSNTNTALTNDQLWERACSRRGQPKRPRSHPATTGRQIPNTPRFPPRPDRGGDEYPI